MLDIFFYLLICLCGFQEVSCLFAPSFVSPWVNVSTSEGLGLTQVLYHNFGVYPVKAEVQVQSTSGFIFPGVSTAQADSSAGIRAGVLCMYSIYTVILYAPNDLNFGSEQFLIYTGTNHWTPARAESRDRGMVRVRLWHPDDFPAPSLVHLFPVSTASMVNSLNVPHGGYDVPEFTVVTGETIDGWRFEAVGSNMQAASALNWGAVVYSVNAENISVLAPVGNMGGLFSKCGGWGEQLVASCLCYNAMVEIRVWHDLGATNIYKHEVAISIGESALFDNSFLTPGVFNVRTDLITVTAQFDVSGVRYHVPGTGAAMSDSSSDSAGLVYAYSDDGSEFRLWYPVGTNAAIIRFGPHMGIYMPPPEVLKIYEAVVTINVWQGTQKSASSYVTVGPDLQPSSHEAGVEFSTSTQTPIAPPSTPTTPPWIPITRETTITTQEPAATTITQEPTVTRTTQEPAATTTTQEPAVTNRAAEPAVTTTVPETTATTTTQEPEATTTAPEPAATTTAPEPSVTTTVQEPASTTTAPEPAVTTTAPRLTTAITAQELTATTTAQTPTATTQEHTVTITAQGPAVTTTAQETTGTAAAPGPAVTTTAQELAATATAPEPAVTTTAPELTTAITAQELTATTTAQTPTATTQEPAVTITAQETTGTTAATGPAVTTTAQELAATATAPEPAVTTTAPELTVTITAQGPAVTTTTQGPAVAITAQGPAVTTTAQETAGTTAAPGPAVTTTAQTPTVTTHEHTVTTIAQEPAATTTTQGPAVTITAQGPAVTTTAQETAGTTAAPGPAVTTTAQELAATATAQTPAATSIHVTQALATASATTVTETLTTADRSCTCPSETTMHTPINDSYVCHLRIYVNESEAIEIAERIAVNLTIQPKTTTRYIRTLTSAPDQRPSSKVIGTIGITIIISYSFLFILADVVNIAWYLACR